MSRRKGKRQTGDLQMAERKEYSDSERDPELVPLDLRHLIQIHPEEPHTKLTVGNKLIFWWMQALLT